MSFTIVQEPERLTPSNTEHVYTINSTLSGENSYKYIVDVWLNPYLPTKTKIARLKSRPNAEGRLIVDIQQIVKDALKANIRVDLEAPFYDTDIMMWRGSLSNDSMYTSKPTIYEAFTKANGGSEPGDIVQPGLESQYHIAEYRVMIGEEYNDSSGTKITNISEGVQYNEELGIVQPSPYGTYPVLFPSIIWSNFVGQYPFVGVNTGVLVEWYNSTETTIKDSVSSTLTTGTYETPTEPVNNDKLVITSQYSGKQWVYYYDAGFEAQGAGWTFVENRIPETYWYGYFMPHSVLSWVGTDNTKLNPLYYSSTTNHLNINGHLYDWSKWVMDSNDPLTKGQFLNIASEPYIESRGGTDLTFRRRTIYKGEPVMFSFFNGYCGEFVNDLRVLTFRWKAKNMTPGSYNIDLEYIIKDHGAGPLVDVSDPYPTQLLSGKIGNRLLHYTKNDIWLDADSNGGIEWFEVNTWNSSTDPSSAWEYDQTASEILRYDVKDISCFDSPLYFVFLNSNGAWDTFTFNARSVKSYNIARKTYTKTSYKNSILYSRQSFDPAKVVYDSEIVVGITAETDYLQEYDSRIVEDLIRSNEVYIVENARLDLVENIPTLIPVVVNTSSVSEYNKKYQKLFQHTIQVEYNNINGYKSSL